MTGCPEFLTSINANDSQESNYPVTSHSYPNHHNDSEEITSKRGDLTRQNQQQDRINSTPIPPSSQHNRYTSSTTATKTPSLNKQHNKPNTGSCLSTPKYSSSKSTSDRYDAKNKEAPSSLDQPTSQPSSPEKEVDYYYNPTELFRWINYRRWDGARARALSNPEECSTWIASRHSADGRILWRHLPLHLVCMNSGINASSGSNESNGNGGKNSNSVEARDVNEYRTPHHNSTQISSPSMSMASSNDKLQVEYLVEALLDIYPQAASKQDDQGMLPLHLCISSNNSSSSIANERVLTMLLMIYPAGINTQDKYGRVPMDLLKEKDDNLQGKACLLKLLNRASKMTKGLEDMLQTKHRSELNSVKENLDHKHQSLQRIILRLEEELAQERKRMDHLNANNIDSNDKCVQFQNDMRKLQHKLSEMELDLDLVRKERDELLSKNEMLSKNLDEHDNSVAQMQQRSREDQKQQQSTIASLKSEANTARAMAEAMEAQIRSRFNNEEVLTNTVLELESEVSNLTNNFEVEKKELTNNVDALTQENELLKKNLEEITSRNVTLQNRCSDLQKAVGNVLDSHSSLNTEYDRLVDTKQKFENAIKESMQIERANITNMLEKQRKIFDSISSEQQRIMDKASQKEAELFELGREERERSEQEIEKLRQHFMKMRSLATENELKSQHEVLLENRNRILGKNNRIPLPANNKENHNNINHKGIKSGGISKLGGNESYYVTTPKGDASTFSSAKLPSHGQPVYKQDKTENVTTPRKGNLGVGNNNGDKSINSGNASKGYSTGLLSIIEERAATASRKPPYQHSPVSSASSSSTFQQYSNNSSRHQSVSFGPTRTTQHTQPKHNPKDFSSTPQNSSSIMRNNDSNGFQQSNLHHHYNKSNTQNYSPTSTQDYDNQTISTSSDDNNQGRSFQKSISLSEYSDDSVSIPSSSSSAHLMATTTQAGPRNNDATSSSNLYRGMLSGMKKGMIRLGSPPRSYGNDRNRPNISGKDERGNVNNHNKGDNNVTLNELRRRYGISTATSSTNSGVGADDSHSVCSATTGTEY